MESTVMPRNETKWPHHIGQVNHRSDKIALYGNYGIYPDDISEYGEPVEIIQGFLLYTGNGNRYPMVEPKWSGGGCDGSTLDIDFKIGSLSNPGKIYNIVTKLDVISDRKEPYLVELARPLKCPCREDDFKGITRYPGPCHQKIAMRMWLENFLYRYTEKRKNLKKLDHTFQMKNIKYSPAKDLRNKDRPWHVSDTISADIIDVYNSLKARRAGSLETINTICEVMQTEYLDKIRRKFNISDKVKLTTRKLQLADFL